ncbi:MAG TPA: DMT family transporter [Bacteroidota bacterium]|nr:DMT family transporter [Bacteroidota bacterium]
MPYAGEISALLTAALWTGSSMAFAAATLRVGSMYVNVVRLIMAALLLPLILLTAGISFSVSSTQISFLIFSGFVGFIFGDTFLFKSFEYNSARICMLIMAFAPAVTAILAYCFLGESLSLMGLLGMTITLAGIALVVLEQPEHTSHHTPISWLGILYAFLGAVGQAGGLILARCAFDRGPVNGILATFIRVVAATVVIVPLNYFTGRFMHPIQVFKNDRRALLNTFLGCVFGPVAGVSFSLISISLTNVAVAATLMATTPLMMLLPVRFIYKERFSWRIILGTIIAVGGVGILFLR